MRVAWDDWPWALQGRRRSAASSPSSSSCMRDLSGEWAEREREELRRRVGDTGEGEGDVDAEVEPDDSDEGGAAAVRWSRQPQGPRAARATNIPGWRSDVAGDDDVDIGGGG